MSGWGSGWANGWDWGLIALLAISDALLLHAFLRWDDRHLAGLALRTRMEGWTP